MGHGERLPIELESLDQMTNRHHVICDRTTKLN